MITFKKNEIEIKNFIRINQKLGEEMIVCKMTPKELIKISCKNERDYDPQNGSFNGIQRKLDSERIKQIKEYIKSDDSSFPNSIIANLDPGYIKLIDDEKIILDIPKENKMPISIIDGQHRLASFEELDEKDSFELIVTIYIGLEIEEQAYLFSIINDKQKRLNPSLVQDLNDLFSIETPHKIVHVLTYLFNNENDSPWKGLIKILGKNLPNQKGIISQYSFSKEITKLIFDDDLNYYSLRDFIKENKNQRQSLKKFKLYEQYKKNYIFWEKYTEKDERWIYKSLLSYFNSIKDNFSGWGDDGYVLSKTTGHIAFMKFYEILFKQEKDKDNLLRKDFFDKIFDKIEILEITSDNYPSGIKGQKKLFESLEEEHKKIKNQV